MKTLILSLMTSSTLLATEPFKAKMHDFEPPKNQNSFAYWSVGAFGPLNVQLPGVGLGYRSQFKSIGLDVNVSVGSYGLEFSEYRIVKNTAMALLYPFPNDKLQVYVGIGPSLMYQYAHEFGGMHRISFFPNTCIGIEKTNAAGKKLFGQLHLEIPYYITKGTHTGHTGFRADPVPFPSIGLRTGFSF